MAIIHAHLVRLAQGGRASDVGLVQVREPLAFGFVADPRESNNIGQVQQIAEITGNGSSLLLEDESADTGKRQFLAAA